jgi:hypothetical protein
MKRHFFLLCVAALPLTGCEKEICGTNDYIIVNRIESDVVVELGFGDRPVMTIRPEDTQMLHHEEWCRDAGVEISTVPEVFQAEMRIDGEVVPQYIWWSEYWDVIDVDIENHYRTYTLTVSDELLETINNRQH